MKNPKTMPVAISLFVFVFALMFVSGCTPEPGSGAQNADNAATQFDAVAAFKSLSAAGSEDGSAWYQLAVNARMAEDHETAAMALERAETLAFPAPRISFEKMRLAIATGHPDAAEDEFQKLADSGFTAVQLFTNDEIINSLAGREKYDKIVAALSASAYPCEFDEGFRDFDFWVGQWVVHGANGQLAGTNTITKAERGCVLIENWTNTAGGTGMSVNYLDRSNNEWVQVWNAEGGSQINIRGGLTDEGMLLKGTLHVVGTGTTLPFRGLWTLLDDGRVRQFFEQSTDGGESWQPWFEGFYTRVETTD